MHTIIRLRIRRGASAAAAVSTFMLAGCGDSDPGVGPVAPPNITVLSSKPEYVSGNAVLVDIGKPATGSTPGPLRVTVNGAVVTPAFAPDPNNAGHMVGLVTGLSEGANVISADFDNGPALAIVTNYANGPILSGPRTTPFNCQTQDFVLPDGTRLGAATDANCSAPTKIQYMYRAVGTTTLRPLPSTTALPLDVATTTTTSGATVPFVVRIETGTMNRGIYQNAILFNPVTDRAPSALTPPPGWNKRLIAVHGTGCATGWYIQGAAMGVSPYTATNMTRLGEGYAVFTNTLNHPTNSCNAHLAGETTLMGKQHFIKTFGLPAMTVSIGTSGGAYTSLQVADAFPDLFDGVFIDATFPDALSIAMSAMDSKLLNRYFTANNGSAVTEPQMVAVSGHKSARAWYDLAVQSGRTDPVSGRTETIPTAGSFGGAYTAGAYNPAVPLSQRWNAVTNPTGARATVFDAGRNVYGIDAQGYALRPFDNVGVQYGLAQLNDGTISVDQFLDLNEKIGGYDRDGNYTAGRTIGSEAAIKRAYQSGLQLGGGGGLASIPVFDLSNFYDEDNFYHYQWFHFAARERMRQANGDTRNHVMWRGGVSFADLFGVATPGRAERAAVNAKAQADAWPLFIRWVAAYKAAAGAATQREKVIANKPAEAVDGCFTLSTAPQFIAEAQTPATGGASGTCNAIWPTWTYPRAQAGASIAADKLKCELKPVTASDYRVTFDPARLARLQAIFPTGTCDWSRAGVGQVAVVLYPSVGPSPVNLIFDITKP
ncbi:MAG: hypothetical protein JWP72_3066 [Massilia sp.]|nr:hypothetical protein [Massilia sp.]